MKQHTYFVDLKIMTNSMMIMEILKNICRHQGVKILTVEKVHDNKLFKSKLKIDDPAIRDKMNR